MKRVADPTQPVITFFFTLCFVIALTIAGCSANTISGPDVTASEEKTVQEALPPASPNAAHNEGEEAGKSGGATSTSGSTSSNGAVHN